MSETKNSKVELNLDDLDKVAGGILADGETESRNNWPIEKHPYWDGKCPYCKSTNVQLMRSNPQCLNCGTPLYWGDLPEPDPADELWG